MKKLFALLAGLLLFNSTARANIGWDVPYTFADGIVLTAAMLNDMFAEPKTALLQGNSYLTTAAGDTVYNYGKEFNDSLYVADLIQLSAPILFTATKNIGTNATKVDTIFATTANVTQGNITRVVGDSAKVTGIDIQRATIDSLKAAVHVTGAVTSTAAVTGVDLVATTGNVVATSGLVYTVTVDSDSGDVTSLNTQRAWIDSLKNKPVFADSIKSDVYLYSAQVKTDTATVTSLDAQRAEIDSILTAVVLKTGSKVNGTFSAGNTTLDSVYAPLAQFDVAWIPSIKGGLEITTGIFSTVGNASVGGDLGVTGNITSVGHIAAPDSIGKANVIETQRARVDSFFGATYFDAAVTFNEAVTTSEDTTMAYVMKTDTLAARTNTQIYVRDSLNVVGVSQARAVDSDTLNANSLTKITVTDSLDVDGVAIAQTLNVLGGYANGLQFVNGSKAWTIFVRDTDQILAIKVSGTTTPPVPSSEDDYDYVLVPATLSDSAPF